MKGAQLTKNRALGDIADDIHKLQRKGLFETGALLNEAKDSHPGEFLDWLDAEDFGWSVDTAERRMSVATLGLKFRKLRNLKLAKTTLYALARDLDDEALPAIVDALVKRATETRLGAAAAETVIELARWRVKYGDFPDATLDAMHQVDGLPWGDAAYKALVVQCPATDEVADKIVADAQQAYETGQPKPEPEPEPEGDDADEGDGDDPEGDGDDPEDDGADEAPPEDTPPDLPKELLEALSVVQHYGRGRMPTAVGGISSAALAEIVEFTTALRNIADRGDQVKRAADRAEARSRRTAEANVTP